MSKYDLKFTREAEDYFITINVWADDELENWFGTMDIEFETSTGKKLFSANVVEDFKNPEQGYQIRASLIEEQYSVLSLAQLLAKKFQ